MTTSRSSSTYAYPDESGRYGDFGGKFIPETLMPALDELEEEYRAARADPAFGARVADLSANYAGRPTPLYLAETLTARAGGTKIYLKREDLAHTGAHKINNVLGPGAPGTEDGQAAYHRRDGGGAAWGGVGDHLRYARPGVHRLHG